jgi:Tol biopolymer transport system component/DNA-binding winged helix-turn-helix (wHTH) protein
LESRDFYDFGDFHFSVKEKLLLRDGTPIPITPKVFTTLKVLIDNHGHLLEKKELMDAIWPDQFVEENNLTYNIKMLRRALSDDAAKPRFIETVPRSGYRFIAEIIEPEVTTPSPPAAFLEPKASRSYWIAAGVVALVLILGGGFWITRQSLFAADIVTAPISESEINSKRLTNSGKTLVASISPDGKIVAFLDSSAGKSSLWLKRLETSENFLLVAPMVADYVGLAWANDGQSIYFVRSVGPGMAHIFSVPTMGGLPVKIVEFTQGRMSASPNGDRISFVRCLYKEEDYCSLFIADADGKNERKLLTRQRPIRIGDNQISPDGSSIAFAVGESLNGGSNFRLMSVNIDSLDETELVTRTFFNIKSLKWLSEPNDLLFTANESLDEPFRLWRGSSQTGEARAISNNENSYSWLSVNESADKIVATQVANNFKLYFSTNGETKSLSDARSASFMADGKIVFGVEQGDIWSINPDGGEKRQLTANSKRNYYPIGSADGKYVFFVSNRTGSNQVWRMDADGSGQFQLTKNEGGYPRFASPDGNWVYYKSDRSGSFWKVRSDGSDEIRVAGINEFAGAFSPDGQLLAYFLRDPGDSNRLKIGIRNLSDNTLIKTLNGLDHEAQPIDLAWSPDSRTINFIVGKNGKHLLWSQTLDAGKPIFEMDMGTEGIEMFKISPDGRSFATIRGNWIHDAVLITGLR